jgi:hypothetical protein
MRKEHCPLKIILANAVREVKCLYRRKLSTCPEDHSQCPIYTIHRRNTLDLGAVAIAAGINLDAQKTAYAAPKVVPQTVYSEPKVIPETKPYEEPTRVSEAYKTEEQKNLEARASESGLSVEDLLRAEQDIILPPPKPIEGDEEEKRYTL